MIKQAGWATAFGMIAWGLIPSPIAHAQEGDGLSYSFSVDQRLNANDNLDFETNSSGTSFTSTTGLGFQLSSETRTQTLRFNLGSTIEGGYFASDDSSDLNLVSPNARFEYTREAARSSFNFGASVRRTDVSTLVLNPDLADPDADPDAVFDTDDLILDDGTRQVTSFSTGLTTGIDTPVRLSFSAGLTRIDYTDTTDPELTDNRTTTLGANAAFDLNPTVELSTFVNLTQFDDQNADDREVDTRNAGVGLRYTFSPTTSLNANISANRVEETEMAVTSVTEGAGFGVSVNNERPDGSIGLSFNRSISANGANDSLNLSRNYTLRDGSLSVSLGVVDGAASDSATTANIQYNRTLSTGSISASLRQNLSTSDDEDVLRTLVAVNYNQEINNISSIGAGLSIANADVLGAGADTRRTSLSLTYNRQMAQDWTLQTGYSFQRAEEEGAQDRSSNSVFIGARKTFSFR